MLCSHLVSADDTSFTGPIALHLKSLPLSNISVTVYISFYLILLSLFSLSPRLEQKMTSEELGERACIPPLSK